MTGCHWAVFDQAGETPLHLAAAVTRNLPIVRIMMKLEDVDINANNKVFAQSFL